MTLALNILPYMLAALGVFLGLRLRQAWLIATTIILLIVYLQVQPSYMPKGKIERSAVPELEQSEATIEDRASKPDSLGERDLRIKEAVQSGLDFKQ